MSNCIDRGMCKKLEVKYEIKQINQDWEMSGQKGSSTSNENVPCRL